MSETPKDKDQEKGDAVLRRLLKTPPAPQKKSEPKRAEKKSAKPKRKRDGSPL